MSAKYLDSSFHIHLLGFGNAEEVDAVEKIVNEYRSNSTIKCKVSYDGVRRGEAYVKYLKVKFRCMSSGCKSGFY